MINVTSISGDVDYVEAELQDLLNDGWDIINLESFTYPAVSSMRLHTVVYLKKTTQL